MGHDHPVIAAAPEALLCADEEPPPRGSLVRALLLGGLVGLAFGALEAALRLQGSHDPSIARRAAGLVTQAAVFYGAAGAAATALLAPLSRLVGVRYAPGFQRALSGLAFLALGVASLCAARVARRAPPPVAALEARDPAPAGGPAGPHLLLVVVDTLRADALGTYGGPPTPALDRLAARGAVFEEAIAPSSWTLPSMASLFSGTYPARHGFTDFAGDLDADGALGLPSLAAELQRAGWATRAVVGNTLLDPAAGFARGFELYDAYDFEPQSRLWLNLLAVRCLRAAGLLAPGVRRVPVPVLTGRFPFVDTRLAFYNLDEDLTDRALRHALPAPTDRPLFLYVHYIAPHTPYLPHPFDLLKQVPDPEHTDPEVLRARYAGEVAYTDRELGRLLEHLEREGLLEQTIVCVTSDHGEAFGERGDFEHGHDLHREAVRVPWIVAGPGVPAGVRIAAPVSLVDLAPTLLALAGLAVPAGVEGRSLLPALQAGEAPARPVFAETSSRYLSPREHHRAAYDGSLRLLRVTDPAGGVRAEAYYDAATDPGEERPLAEQVAAGPAPRALATALEDYAGRSAPMRGGRDTAVPDLEAMRALGYVDGAAGGASGDPDGLAGDGPTGGPRRAPSEPGDPR